MDCPPVLQEILRASLPIRPEVLRRWQQAIRDEVAPLIADRTPAEKPVATQPRVSA